MTVPTGANLYGVSIGTRPEGVEIPVYQNRAPASTDVLYDLGKQWVDTVANAIYFLSSFSSLGGTVTANWVAVGGGSSQVSNLTGDTGTATPVGGSIAISGTINQISTAASGSSVVLSVPSSFVAPGSITAANGNLTLGTAGNKIVSTSVGTTTVAGANSFGSVALVGGTATVSTSAVTANSLIFLTQQTLGTISLPAALAVTAKTALTSFVITSSEVTDTSTVAWFIVN